MKKEREKCEEERNSKNKKKRQRHKVKKNKSEWYSQDLFLQTWANFKNVNGFSKSTNTFQKFRTISNKTNNILNAKNFKHDFSRMCTEFWNA